MAGQFYRHRSAHVHLTGDFKRAAVQIDGAFDDRHPQAGALNVADVACPMKCLKQVGLIFGRDANTLIGNLEDRFISLAGHLKLD